MSAAHPSPNIHKLVLVGAGLIGGSFALALKNAGCLARVTGIGRNRQNLLQAQELGIIDEVADTVAPALRDADLVMLAVPVGQMGPVMASIAPHLGEQTIITDVGSTKQDILRLARAHLGDHLARFVPAHPIAGAETSGPAAARAELFQGKNLLLTPVAETAPAAIRRVEALWQACGAIVTRMDAAQHDAIFAAVSHLPHLLSFALVDELSGRENAAQLFQYAAGGFRDFTRIAASHPEMWRDISLANRECLLAELKAYQAELARMVALLENADAGGLEQIFTNARNARRDWRPR